MGDADDSHDFTALDPFVERQRARFEPVMGNRFKGGIRKHAMSPLHRYVGSTLLATIGRVLFDSRGGDFHCDLPRSRRESILGLGVNSPCMTFASEMVVKATLHKLRITEVPSTLSPDGA